MIYFNFEPVNVSLNCEYLPDRKAVEEKLILTLWTPEAGIPAARYINATARSRYTGGTVINARGRYTGGTVLNAQARSRYTGFVF